MKAKERDELLVRLDEKMHGVGISVERMCKAIIGLYGVWGAIVVTAVGAAVVAAVRGN